MPYREKIAWLSLIAMAVALIPYFAVTQLNTGTRGSDLMPNLHQLGLYAAAVLVELLILGVGHLYLRRTTPKDERTPPDERDRAILSRAVSWAYYVLIAGMIQVGCFMPFSAGGWAIVNAAIFAIVVSEVVRNGVTVVSYRRQA